MTILPSPIPHPLDLLPWDLPGWAYEGLNWVVGVEWPEGDEKAVWDIADQWYGVAASFAGPRDDAHLAARDVIGGFGDTGAVGKAFGVAWRDVSQGEEAPLLVLPTISQELGRIVEECGCDIEGAKIEVWIQLGILVVELIALTVAVALTLGAASPAAAAAMAATRLVVQQIFRRLGAQLARKAIREGVQEAAERAAREVGSRGLKNFTRYAAIQGAKEAGEEVSIDLGTQLHQNDIGRRDGLDARSLGMSAVGGFAGGAAASLAALGPHAAGRAAQFAENIGRGMTGEVLAEQAASLATGNGLTALDDAARAATSGATSAGINHTTANLSNNLDSRLDALSGVPPVPVNLAAPDQAGEPAPGPATSSGAADGPADRAGVASPADPLIVLNGSVNSSGQASSADADIAVTDTVATQGKALGLSTGATTDSPSDGQPANTAATVSVPADSSVTVSATTASVTTAGATADGRTADGATAGTASHGAPSVVQSGSATSDPTPVPVSSTAPTVPGPAPVAESSGPSVATASTPVSTSTPVAPTPTVQTTSPAPTVATEAQLTSTATPVVPAPRTPMTPPPDPVPSTPPVVPTPPPPPPAPPRPTPEQLRSESQERQRYAEHARAEREWYERNRRDDESARLRADSHDHFRRYSRYAAEGDRLRAAGDLDRAQVWSDAALGENQLADLLYGQANAVQDGTLAPDRHVIENDFEFRRLNRDVGLLTAGPLETGTRSALTGDDGPAPADTTRPYGVRGGLRPPLALHQRDLETRMPRDDSGEVVRTADPRAGGWFALANDGGPAADPTRAINCLDGTLSLYETWVHGRPRVSAPRTFDGYSYGNIDWPIDGEHDGPGRVEDVTGGRFQQLCPDVRTAHPAIAQAVVRDGFASLTRQLQAGGHGSYAFIINTWEGGASHAWAAINQNGTVLYLDPQNGRISPDLPLYEHHGIRHDGNVASIDALVLDGNGRPVPVPDCPPGVFTSRPPLPEDGPEPAPDRDAGPEPTPREEGEAAPAPPVLLLPPPVPDVKPTIWPEDVPEFSPVHRSPDQTIIDPPPTPAKPPPDSPLPGPLPPAGAPAGPPSPAGPAPDRPEPAEPPTDAVSPADGRSTSGLSVVGVMAAAPNLAAVLEAGVTPAQAATYLDPSTLQRFTPTLTDADARDVARFLSDPRVQRAIDESWTTPPRAEPMLAALLLRQLTQQPDLVRMVQSSPALSNSLTARPLTLHHLASHPQAVEVLGEVLADIATRGAETVAEQGAASPRPTPLSNRHRELVASITLSASEAVQSDFDYSRRADPVYRAAYLDRLYEGAAVAQTEINELARRISNQGQAGGGEPGWRTKPKDRRRTEDKVENYQGDASRITDLAGAMVQFESIDDLYGALERLQQDPNVEIVQIEDRFAVPQRSGYRDIQMLILASNGHIAEFRLHLAAIDDVAVWEHALFEVRRDVAAIVGRDGRAFSPEERAIYDGIQRQQQRLFWEALQSTIRERP